MSQPPSPGAPAGAEPGPDDSDGRGPVSRDPLPAPLAPLLGRLNRHGFRLVMVADLAALLVVMFGTMLVRFGTDWPTYPVPTYLVSFSVVTAIFLAALYFGGLYEREPRLGAPPALPRAARQTLGAGGLTALLDLAVSGVLRELGWTAERALPFPITNLVVLITLGAVLIATNRWLAHRLRTRREGLPRVLLAGDPDEVAAARGPLADPRAGARVVAEVTDPAEVLTAQREHRATDVVVVSGSWLQGLYPRALEGLDQAGVTALLRVTGRETVYGLERIREVAGMPFVLLRAQTMPISRRRFKRFFDVTLLLVAAPVWVPVVGLAALYQLVVAGRPVLDRKSVV